MADPALTHAATAYWSGKVAELQGENAQLRSSADKALSAVQAEAKRLQAENERLKGRIAAATAEGYADGLHDGRHERGQPDDLRATLERLEHLLSSPGDMSRDEIRAEGRRLIAGTRLAADDSQQTETES